MLKLVIQVGDPKVNEAVSCCYFLAQTYTIISYIGGNLLWMADQLEHSDAILTAENVRFSSELSI